MKITYYNEDIPPWLKPHMKIFCECGGVMADDGPVDYRGIMKLTQRFCLNPYCPYHMGEKIQMLAKYFNLVGVGEETAINLVKSYKLENHLEVLKLWFPQPPEVYLYEVGELAYIYGLKGQCKDLFGGYRSFEDYFAEENYIPEIVQNNKNYLLQCQSYFRIRKDVLSTQVLRVMLTGSIRGFNSRRDFLEFVNERCKPYFRVEDNKKTVRDTYCLVKEPESVDYSKTQIAINHNIPIMSSAKFVALLDEMKGVLENEDTRVY